MTKLTTKKRRQYRHLPAFKLLMIGEKPLHGNAIHNLLVERMGITKLDSGAIYRTLKLLEDAGEVKSEWDNNQVGPAIKIYSLTQLGWKKLGSWHKEIEERVKQLQNYLKISRSINKSKAK